MDNESDILSFPIREIERDVLEAAFDSGSIGQVSDLRNVDSYGSPGSYDSPARKRLLDKYQSERELEQLEVVMDYLLGACPRNTVGEWLGV